MDLEGDLTPDEREIIAQRLRVEQRVTFGGVKKDAYTRAGVNSATWQNAIAGTRVRPDRLIRIVSRLWPESRGEWDRVPPAEASEQSTTGVAGDLEERVSRLEETVAALLGRVTDPDVVEDLEEQGPPPPSEPPSPHTKHARRPTNSGR